MILKGVSLLALLVLIAADLRIYGCFYSEGWWVTPKINIPLLPMAISFLAGFVVFWTWVISLIRRNARAWTSGMMVGMVASIVIFRLVLAPGCMIAYGFRDRILKTATLDDLRQLAQTIDKEDLFWNFNENIKYASKQDADEMRSLQSRFPFLTFSARGLPVIQDVDGVVDVCWKGGVLQQSRGFSVRLDKTKNIPPPGSDRWTLPASDDIYFFLSDY